MRRDKIASLDGGDTESGTQKAGRTGKSIHKIGMRFRYNPLSAAI